MGYSCLRSVNGRKYDTYKEACYALGLLSDDKEFIDLITDASETYSGHQLRSLFVRLMGMSTLTNVLDVWNAAWRLLSDDILYHRRRDLHMPGTKYLLGFYIINKVWFIYDMH